MKRILILLSGLFILGSFHVAGQDTLAYRSFASYPFINHKANTIKRSALLHSFYEKLITLKNDSTREVVNLIHLGDSHIQADYLTKTTRSLLQQEFGNAGAGLIFPGRLARTNEPPMIYSSSAGIWEFNKITLSQDAPPIGIAGISLKTSSAGNTIKIKTLAEQYSFNRIRLFFNKTFDSYQVLVKDSIGQTLGVVGSFTDENYPNVSKLILPYSINQVQLETAQAIPSQKHFILYGMSLENSNPGILYHAIGVNGAKYRHFIKAQELLNQTAALNPDIIIISLGTNEAVDHPNLDPAFTSHVNTLVAELKKINPNATIVLTTPSDFYKKRTRRNPGIEVVKNKIIEYANEHHLPYWDLHEVAGGNHSADQWKREALLQPDGIHFTKKGYELQGQLLFEAIIKGYHEYVLDRSSKTH